MSVATPGNSIEKVLVSSTLAMSGAWVVRYECTMWLLLELNVHDVHFWTHTHRDELTYELVRMSRCDLWASETTGTTVTTTRQPLSFSQWSAKPRQLRPWTSESWLGHIIKSVDWSRLLSMLERHTRTLAHTHLVRQQRELILGH